MYKSLLSLFLLLMPISLSGQQGGRFDWITVKENRVVRNIHANGDQIPDFSTCGYDGSSSVVPDVPAVISIDPVAGDNTARVQQAIDQLAKMPLKENGWRGAILLGPGKYDILGTLKILSSGIAIRGSLSNSNQTTLVATGIDRDPLICVTSGEKARSANNAAVKIVSPVAVGSPYVELEDAAKFKVGDAIKLSHPGTKAWISQIGMDQFPSDDGKGSWLDWKPGEVDLAWNRTIEKIEGNRITLNAVLTSRIDPAISPATVMLVDTRHLLKNISIEHLNLESTFDSSNIKDEDHAWDGINIDHALDCLVSHVNFKHFAGSAVFLGTDTQRVTVADCQSTEPVSELAAFRRRTFFTNGQQTLFLRCKSHSGRNDFSAGHLACGPNAFVDCQADAASSFSGPMGRWVNGLLFDNVIIDGAPLALTNLETAFQGIGWTSANCVCWNCVAPQIICRKPPTANNWAIGVWGEFAGDGYWKEHNSFISPDSFFQAQLSERVGTELAKKVISSREDYPSYKLPQSVAKFQSEPAKPIMPAHGSLKQKDGWLTIGDRLAIGKRMGTTWWRGSILPAKAPEFGPHVTRFVPGLVGQGYTDNLSDVVNSMSQENIIALEHHWGLWYDRRRDDHEMFRRINSDVCAPFYEFPWARSGVGTAWDGLSKYDLTKFNPCYFSRLKQFADLCDQENKLLISQMYFQHNILEAGAHWVDFPWRPANCLQATGFPEPPPFENRKRIFMADEFYDITHPVRRELHTAYIRQVLNVLSDHNVLFVLGDEYTGPLHFTRFWLETVQAWEKETGKNVLVGISCTKDVQDEVLADTQLEPVVDVIELKYWWYTSDGGLYNPAGGKNLAPRQQYREWVGNKQKSQTQTARMIHEYRSKFPSKSILTSFDSPLDPWLQICAGGSMPVISNESNLPVIDKLHQLKPLPENSFPEKTLYTLHNPEHDYLVYSGTQQRISLNLGSEKSTTSFAVSWIDTKSSQIVKQEAPVSGGQKHEITVPADITLPTVLWLTSTTGLSVGKQ